MKHGSSRILRAAVWIAGIAVAALCVGIGWWVAAGWAGNADHHAVMVLLTAGVCASAVPYFIALRQALRLLDYIDTGRAFSELSVTALTVIMRCAAGVFGISAAGGLPFFSYWAKLDDAPGLVIIGLIVAGAAFVIAVFASLLRRLLGDAIALKSENDLTV